MASEVRNKNKRGIEDTSVFNHNWKSSYAMWRGEQ